MKLDNCQARPTRSWEPINKHEGISTNMRQLKVAWLRPSMAFISVHNKGMHSWLGPFFYQGWLWEFLWVSLKIVHYSCSKLDGAPYGCSHGLLVFLTSCSSSEFVHVDPHQSVYSKLLALITLNLDEGIDSYSAYLSISLMSIKLFFHFVHVEILNTI